MPRFLFTVLVLLTPIALHIHHGFDFAYTGGRVAALADGSDGPSSLLEKRQRSLFLCVRVCALCIYIFLRFCVQHAVDSAASLFFDVFNTRESSG